MSQNNHVRTRIGGMIVDRDADVCQRIRVTGLVRGVGFRPFVWRLAKALELKGWVLNDASGVDIEARGPEESLRTLVGLLRSEAPALARIESLTARPTLVHSAADDFFILNSRAGKLSPMIASDTAVCRDCLAEIFDPENRRWRYAFAGCAHCGPRYTICRGLPYARERTSLKAFAPCAKCANEARRPEGRQQQNEAIACPKCGPQIHLVDAGGQRSGGDAVAATLGLLRQGRIVAIKGDGGFHLAADARNAAAVAELRRRLDGDPRPYPVMLANATSASVFVQLGVGEPGLLGMPERPIILLKKRAQCDAALLGVAPGFGWLGVLMPSTPLHYLVFHEAADRPHGLAWLAQTQALALVMVGAGGAEPLAVGNEEARERLAGIADAFLLHDREIVTPCDDTVARSGPGGLQLVRRARGYAPRAIKLPRSGPPILALGGDVKNTVCLTRGDEAFVSQHIGDLDGPATRQFFEQTIAQLLKFLDVKPALVVHDLDGEMHASRYAVDFARGRGLPALAVQHSHAHVAAVLAEHSVEASLIALALDGVGRGADGAGSGGELLRVEGTRAERLGSLCSIRSRGGHGARQPWRMAAEILRQLGRGDEIEKRFASELGGAAGDPFPAARGSENVSLSCQINAAAGLLGVKPTCEGAAGMALETLAENHGDVAPLAGGWRIEDGRLVLLPLFAALADESDPARGAALFHSTLVAALADWAAHFAPANSTIVGAGGCFLNLVLARGLRARLNERGLHLLEARRLPANDGGLSLGQAWVGQQYLLGYRVE